MVDWITNKGWEDGDVGDWAVGGDFNAPYVGTHAPRTGSYALNMELIQGGITWQQALLTINDTAVIAALRGKTVTFTIWLRVIGANGTQSGYVRIYDDKGNTDTSGWPNVTTAYTQHSVSITVAADATSITLRLYTAKTANPYVGYYIDDLDLVESPAVVAPTVSTDPATLVAANSATLNGTLDDDGEMPCDCGFEWGETIAYGNTTPTQSRTTGQTFSQAISGLGPGTTYHFRAFATNLAGTSYGSDRTFTALVAAPTVTTDPASALSAISATLNGTLDDDGGEACDCGFEWGLDTGYGTVTPTESKTTGETFSQVIGGLVPNTTYHFRALATNSAGTGHGADRSFASAPVISRAYALARREL